MIQLKRILVPTDFSDCSRLALRYGVALGEAFGSEVHLIHVLQDLISVAPEAGMAFPPPGEYFVELRTSAEQSLAQMPGAETPTNCPVVRRVLQGPPFVEIIRYARENDIDLIVVGTHGRSGLAHMLLGSVTERVVRKAPCPVLTVRPEGHQFEMP